MPIRPINPHSSSPSAPDAEQVPSPPRPPVRQRTRVPSPSSVNEAHGDVPPSKASTGPAVPPDYDVGYRKPPLHTRFQAGRSGNPRGRPKAAKGLKTIVRETLTAKVLVRSGAGERKMSRMEAVLHKTIELAMKGNSRAQLQLTSLYASAVPEAALPLAMSLPTEELTASDLAMLEELKASILSDRGDAK